MRERLRNVALVAGGALIAAALLIVLVTDRAPLSPQSQAEAVASNAPDTTPMPSIDQMCAAMGAGDEELLQQCRADESAAGEYVVAWMALHGFLAEGGIDVGQIQLHAELDGPDPLLSPSVDPLAGGSPEIDPVTGEVVPGSIASPAKIALLCLMNSTDWIALHDCISQSDPSAGLDASLLGPDSGASYLEDAGVQ